MRLAPRTPCAEVSVSGGIPGKLLPVHSAVAFTSMQALASGVRMKIEFDDPPPGSGIAMMTSATLTGV
jgi:hypothetical protein